MYMHIRNESNFSLIGHTISHDNEFCLIAWTHFSIQQQTDESLPLINKFHINQENPEDVSYYRFIDGSLPLINQFHINQETLQILMSYSSHRNQQACRTYLTEVCRSRCNNTWIWTEQFRAAPSSPSARQSCYWEPSKLCQLPQIEAKIKILKRSTARCRQASMSMPNSDHGKKWDSSLLAPSRRILHLCICLELVANDRHQIYRKQQWRKVKSRWVRRAKISYTSVPVKKMEDIHLLEQFWNK
jgi:hypothetical protein